ncbi:MAG: yajC [Microbacteriaceae bacterium]|jgi:preprotein translocase subunit YajC|nr:yajC [Microbacteriaceae bacterium]HEV7956051.1 preprotein translocase subunit YajC [Marisediminicola sp.]
MDPTFILLIVALGAFIVFQVFQGRKRRRETEERQTRFVPGVEIMTNYGLYGTILHIDDDKNLATIETTPGTVLKIHRQTILKVADYDEVPVLDDESESVDVDSDAAPAADASVGTTTEPAFGERLEPVTPDPIAAEPVAPQTGTTEPESVTPVKKRATRTVKKVDE